MFLRRRGQGQHGPHRVQEGVPSGHSKASGPSKASGHRPGSGRTGAERAHDDPLSSDERADAARQQKRRLALVAGTFIGLLLVSLASSWAAIDIVNSTRTYATGEGRYSKAQKIAVLALHRYAHDGRLADYEAFLRAIDVPRGDRDARLALEAPEPDVAAARAGFLRGQNHPEDIPGAIRLFRLFYWWGPFAAAVEDWRNGDARVAELLATGMELHRLVAAGELDATRRDSILERIDRIDHELTVLEDRFSSHIGEAARSATGLVILGLGAFTVILWALGMALAARLLRQQLALDRRLAASEARFRDFAEVASDWYWETDAQDRTVFMSARFFEATGRSRADTLGHAATGLLGAHLGGRAARERIAAFVERRPFRDLHLRLAQADGRIGYWSLSGKPCFDDDGRFRGYRGIGTDITAAVEDAQSLRQAKERAEIANKAKSEFLANMSHELRTPLNAILGFSEVIRDRLFGAEAGGRYARYAADIHTSGSHLLSIIDDILDLSKIEGGHSPLEESEIAVADLLARTRTLLGDRAERAGLVLRMDAGEAPLALRGDERKLKQALLNLLTNAVKFTPRGGTVEVSVLGSGAGEVAIVVRDTGIGVARKDFATVLAPFGQVESAYRRRHHGTGLGLPMARALVEMHGGRIALESEVGNGTAVSILLPRWRVVPAPAAGCTDPAAAALPVAAD